MSIKDLFVANKSWSAGRIAERADYFERLANLQQPEYLWIGCSDSRVPANVITGLEPGEVFVHRNVANLIHPTDLNMLSVVEFAVNALGVKHIIICGHYGCGGVRAAMSAQHSGLVDNWLQPIRDVAKTMCGCRDWSATNDIDLDRLCEESVKLQVNRLADTSTLREAWRKRTDIAVHGWIYGLRDGLLADLNCCRDGATL